MSRWPEDVARERGGNLRTRAAVSLGIPWMYPRERARRKVEMGGEPKAMVISDKACKGERVKREKGSG